MRSLLFDDTALLALFHVNPRVWELWQRAEREDIILILPAAAIVPASAGYDSSDQFWTPFLHAGPNVIVVELTGEQAVEAGRYSDNASIGQSSVLARDTDATIITSRRGEYDGLLRVKYFN